MKRESNQASVSMLRADDVAGLIVSSRSIIAAVGAGISVSCGIPDFRSEKIGLYTSGRHVEDGIPSAELFFDFEYFQLDPAPFYRVAKSLIEIDPLPSKTHDFLSWLEKLGKIRRIYTQNIDGLEHAAGCRNVVQCHGTMETLHCMKCKKKETLANCKQDIIDLNSVPHCRVCRTGVLKPDIVFFGENCPAKVSRNMSKDCSTCDLVLIIGTSLKVQGPVTLLIDSVPNHVPRVLINNELVSYLPVSSGVISDTGKKRKVGTCEYPMAPLSAALLGPCDDVVQYICDVSGWADDLVQAKLDRPIKVKAETPFSNNKIVDHAISGDIISNLRRSSRTTRPSKKMLDLFCDVDANKSDKGYRGRSLSHDENIVTESTCGTEKTCDSSMLTSRAMVFSADPDHAHVFKLQHVRSS